MPGEAPRERPAAQNEPRAPELSPASDYRRLRPGPGLSKEEVAAHQRSRLQRAMVEIVATHGYEALTVRGLAQRARVSSGTFYSRYRSTDDCLLSTFDLICRRTSKRLLEAGRDEPSPRRRLALAVERLFRDMTANPQAATFMLRGAPAAGPAFTSRLRNSGMRLGVALEFCLRAGDGPHLPPLLVEGIVAGLARIGRVRVPAVGEDELSGIAAEAAEWITSLSLVSTQGAELPLAAAPSKRRKGPAVPQSLNNVDWEGAPGDERAMILAAAFRVAKRGGYHQLSVPRICREAGTSRRRFNRYFEGLEDCFCSALEERVAVLVESSVGSWPPSAPWSAAVYEVLGALCAAIEADVDSARVLLVEVAAVGTEGIDSSDRQISQIARALRATASDDRAPSELAAEASTAAAWAILRRRASERNSTATASILPLLAFLALAPAIGAPAALRTIADNRGQGIEIKKRNV